MRYTGPPFCQDEVTTRCKQVMGTYSLLYEAKLVTQERSGSIKKKNDHGFTTKMAYFFAVLEDKLGFKPHRPKKAD